MHVKNVQNACFSKLNMRICHFPVAVLFVHEKASLTFRRYRAYRMPRVSGSVAIAGTSKFCLKFPIHRLAFMILSQLIITQR